MKIHIVQKGDTLWEIAKKYDVDFEELKQQNSHLASPDMIMPGMKIRIPTHSKKITTEDKKQMFPKKDIMAEPPVKSQPSKMEKSIELPQMPTFPLEQEKPLSTQEQKVKEYPTSILPKLPETPKKHEKPKSIPKPEVMPEKTSPPKESFQPTEQPIFMPPALPSYPQAQMMPMVTYPCQGFMPMPIQPMGCGCGGMQGFPVPYQTPQAMYPAPNPGMYPGMMGQPIENQGFTGYNQQVEPQMYRENFTPPAQPEISQDSLKMYPAPNQGFTGYNQQPVEPQMRPENFIPSAQPDMSQDFLQMYPEPPLGMRDQKQELYPTPNESVDNPLEKGTENDDTD